MDNPTQLQQENERLRAQLEEARREISLLRQKLDALAQRVFGKKSEQLDPAQLRLLLSGLSEQIVELPGPEKAMTLPMARRERQAPRRIRTPEDLDVVREVIEPEGVQNRPEAFKRIGEEVSRKLDYQPGRFFWHETVRPRYVALGARQLPPVIAPAPAGIVEHGLAAPGLLAQLLVGKYADHLPFYRQEQIFWRRHQVFISRQQMVQWVEQSVRLLSGITDHLKATMRRGGYVQVDETPVRYQDPETPGRCGQGYLWTALVPGQCVVYEWHASRAARCLDSLLGGEFTGKIQCDAYSAYPAYAREKAGLELIGCWAHVRRGFFEAREQAPRVAGWMLNQIGLLYEGERRLRKARAGPVEREVYRRSHSKMVVDRIHRALGKLRARYLPQSAMGRAISYALNQWALLDRFLDHGEVEIDNNLVENAIRPTAIGKKNWLFFGSEEAGQRSAVMYTLIENCRLHGVEPYAYLKNVLERLPTATNHQIASLTPRNWAGDRQNPPARLAA